MLKHFDHVAVALTDLAALEPPVEPEADIARVDRIGFNRTRFAVSGVGALNGVTVELAEWT
jgi:hypothetical protein